jgi:hypothetical protein
MIIIIIITSINGLIIRGIILKLLAFSFAMIVSPIAFYFITINSVFRGKLFLFPFRCDVYRFTTFLFFAFRPCFLLIPQIRECHVCWRWRSNRRKYSPDCIHRCGVEGWPSRTRRGPEKGEKSTVKGVHIYLVSFYRCPFWTFFHICINYRVYFVSICTRGWPCENPGVSLASVLVYGLLPSKWRIVFKLIIWKRGQADFPFDFRLLFIFISFFSWFCLNDSA